MGKVFEYSAGRGSLKDHVNGTIPDNTGVTIKNSEKGRACYFDGSAYLDYGGTASNILGSAVTQVSWDIVFRGSANTWDNDGLFAVTPFTGGFRIGNNIAATTIKTHCDTSFSVGTISDTDYHHLLCTYDGAEVKTYLDNVLINTTPKTVVLDFTTTATKTIVGGYYKPAFLYSGYGIRAAIFSHVLNNAERAALYSDFQRLKTQMKSLVNFRDDGSDRAVFFRDDGTNWNADGITHSEHIADYSIDSGSFRCKEDSTGKYLESVTSGAISFQGVELSSLTGNGYIRNLQGDLSGDEGGTVAAASAVAWAGNILTLTMTAGQKLRGITITRGA